MQSPQSRNDFRWALAVLVFSGAAALGHQLLWTRRMADLIGATGEATARVFGCFFLGLALGAAVAAVIMPRVRRPWRTVALIELGIASLSLPALLLNSWSAPLWPAVGSEYLLSWRGAWLKSLLSVLVVLPPAFLVGMTLPVLTAAVCRAGKDVSRDGVWLYGAYTLGGALGVAVVAGVALHWLGAAGSMRLMIGTNAFIGAVCFLRDQAVLPPAEHAAQAPAATPATDGLLPRKLLMLLSFISGAGVLALEVAGLHLLNLKAPLAFFMPAAILFCVVLLLACSAALAAAVARLVSSPAPALTFSCALAGLAAAIAPLLFLAVTAGSSGIGGHGASLAGSLLQLGVVTCLSLGPAVLVAGMVFPLLISSIGWAPPHSPVTTYAQLLAVNGVGGLLGAEIAHRLLLPSLGVHLALGALGACYGLVALALALAWRPRRALRLAFPVGSIAATCFLLATSLKHAPIFLRGSTFSLVELRSGREGTLAVAERQDVGRAMFLDNHYMLGCSAGAPDMQRQAHVPLLLQRQPRQVCFIGLGTGVTAAGALQHGAVESIEAIELCPLVAEAATTHFGQFNQNLASDPKARVHVEDARTYIASAKGRFDVIVGDLFTPWRPGEARLCSLEHFMAVKAALRRGGVFCQWLPMTQLTRQHFELIAATFQQVFGKIYLFRDNLQNRSLPIALVGFREADLDWDVVAGRCESERTEGRLRDPLCRHPEGLAMLYLGTCNSAEEAAHRSNTLDNLQLELDAGRHLIAGNPADYFAGTSDPWLGFVQAQLSRIESGQELPPALRSLPRLALSVSRWHAARDAGDPDAPELRRQWNVGLPACLLTDPAADQSLWLGQEEVGRGITPD